MSRSNTPAPGESGESTFREYPLNVRILKRSSAPGDDPQYRFEAPRHEGISFDDPERAQLYADVYFDVNGFQESGTGDRGIPPEIVQAGQDTLAAYFLTMPGVDENWVASFYGIKNTKVERYASWVRTRAEEIRDGIEERGLD